MTCFHYHVQKILILNSLQFFPSLFVWLVISHSSIILISIQFSAKAIYFKVWRGSVFRISRLINYILLKGETKFLSILYVFIAGAGRN